MISNICFTFGHLEFSNGVSKAAISIANAILEHNPDISITFRPLYKCSKEILSMLSPKITVDPCFGFYFRGFDKIVDLIPDGLLYNIFFKGKYNMEIAFQFGLPTKIIAAGVSITPKASRISWMHGYDYGLTLREQYLKIGKVICVSKYNADRLRNEINSKEICVDYVYNPVNNLDICQQGMEPIDITLNDNLQLVTVGRLSPEKGYDRLLDVAYRLKEDGYNFNLWIIGNGPQNKMLRGKATKLRLENCVNFLGEQKNPHKYTSKADVYICSSLSEGYSTSCTEAIMLGIPVITTDIPGGGEIIEDSQCGFLTENDNESLYFGIKAVLDDHSIVTKWKTILAVNKNNFSYKNRVAKLYKELGI